MLKILVGARASPLSQVQVKEVENEIQKYSKVTFETILVASQGDKDQKISLRTLNKTDFFTKEIDEMLIQGYCRLGIHSAKDLPEPLPKGLCIVALTKGLDPSDSLVMRAGNTLENLPKGALIATSSIRREEVLRKLRPDFTFSDLRGTIGHRLSKLELGEADGVVVAEAALIRLGLTRLNRIRLPGETVPLQGQLAVLAREKDREMKVLFESIDSRKKVLYLGTEVPLYPYSSNFTHYPVIKIVPRPPEDLQSAFAELNRYTHLIFTSKSTVDIFLKYLKFFDLDPNILLKKTILAVGKATAQNLPHPIIAQNEQAEGILEELEKLSLQNAYVFWPHSALSRKVIIDYLVKKEIMYRDEIFYDTVANQPGMPPDPNGFDEIIFTSPSTVDHFLAIYKKLPQNAQLTPIGSITKEALKTNNLTLT